MTPRRVGRGHGDRAGRTGPGGSDTAQVGGRRRALLSLAGAAVLALLATLASPWGSAGQEATLQDLDGVDGWVAFEVATREGVRICDHGINRGRWRGSTRRDECFEGSVTVLLDMEAGRVRSVEHVRPGSRRNPAPDLNLGWVATDEAAGFLLGLVAESPEEVATDALSMAAMVDSVTLWPELERFATDRSLHDEVRESALFWLGQEAAAEAVRGITQVLDTPDETVDIKEAAVFALSQRPDSVSVPLLLDVARSADHPDVKESAFFWLSQKDDPRVVEFFLEVLRG